MLLQQIYKILFQIKTLKISFFEYLSIFERLLKKMKNNKKS